MDQSLTLDGLRSLREGDVFFFTFACLFCFVCRRGAASSATPPILEEATTAASPGVAVASTNATAAAAAASTNTTAAARGASSSPPSAAGVGVAGGEGAKRDSGSGRGHLSETEEVRTRERYHTTKKNDTCEPMNSGLSGLYQTADYSVSYLFDRRKESRQLKNMPFFHQATSSFADLSAAGCCAMR